MCRRCLSLAQIRDAGWSLSGGSSGAVSIWVVGLSRGRYPGDLSGLPTGLFLSVSCLFVCVSVCFSREWLLHLLQILSTEELLMRHIQDVPSVLPMTTVQTL